MRSVPDEESLFERLSEFEPRRRSVPNSAWPFGGPSVVVPYRPAVNGWVDVDPVDHVWPDLMGNPTEDSDVFGAWSLGHFGPFAYPGNLLRATQHAWGWPEARDVAGQHAAFVRVRTTYVFGAQDYSPVMPEDYLPLPELTFATEVAEALLGLDAALCYFNPNGERLLPSSEVTSLLARGRTTGPLPLELWINIRLFNLSDVAGWILMDTVGMQQLDAPDHEACFQRGAFDPIEVDNFLFNAACYVFENGPVIQDGDTMDGPGGMRWQGATFESGRAEPPREVIRWLPLDGRERPPQLTDREDVAGV